MKVVVAFLAIIVLAAFILPENNNTALATSNPGKTKGQVQPENPLTTITALENLLTGKTWQVMEVNDLSNCHNTHYLRGASENTGADYDPLQFTFRKNHTGVHTDTENNTYKFDWKFSDAQTLEIVVRAYSPVRYVWRMVEVTENKLTATTPINLQGGKDVLVTATYAPVNTKQIPFDNNDRTALLTAQTWLVDEVYNNAGCSNVVYRRNETESTDTDIPYQQLRLQFHADGDRFTQGYRRK